MDREYNSNENEICDVTFGNNYFCFNEQCEVYNIPHIVHTCKRHPITEEKVCCHMCGRKMTPEKTMPGQPTSQRI